MSSNPRLASTVVLMDDFAKVYLTKRPETMKFMGGVYVFPGGTVDQSDDVLGRESLIVGTYPNSFSIAHCIAAARELFEEVGVLVCKGSNGATVHLSEETAREYRRLLIKREMTFLDFLQTEGLQLDLEQLTYIGHIITPKQSPIRFDTRFFLTQLPTGQTTTPDRYEISDAKWITPTDALAAFRNGDISLVPPTIHTLRTLIHYQEGGQLIMPEFNVSDYRADLKD
ncbi:NUDIX hydrolase [Neobacillus jeddahensis]|uniref:NUDIX hydrolase n=1 Tax=Neobacillus jeddahensis TaxID=1461580 RepID=UPI0006941CD2|nr:NUDIX hydrolase [Neobacillus jeddahensis]